MIKSCLTCSFYLPQVYNKKILPSGICIHLAFFKSGIGKMVDDEVVAKHRNNRNRLTPEVVTPLQDDGEYWLDIIDIRNKFRVCTHYLNPVSYAKQAMDYYGDSFNNYNWIHPAFIRWRNDGCPLKKKHFKKFRDFHLYDYDVPDVEDSYFEDKEDESPYRNCSMCHHFEWSLNSEGKPRPFLGRCKQSAVSGGLFDIGFDSSSPTVYSFMSCKKFLLDRVLDKNLMLNVVDVPIKLLPFVETNDMNISMKNYESICSFPSVTKRVLIDPEEHQRILDIDLIKLLKKELARVKRKQFYKEMGLRPVGLFFSTRIKRATKTQDILYKKFKFYDEISIFNSN